MIMHWTSLLFCIFQESEKEEREVKQFHFTVWPDHGVPEYPTALLAFRRRLRAYNPADAGPPIVHCRYDVCQFKALFWLFVCQLACLSVNLSIRSYT